MSDNSLLHHDVPVVVPEHDRCTAVVFQRTLLLVGDVIQHGEDALSGARMVDAGCKGLDQLVGDGEEPLVLNPPSFHFVKVELRTVEEVCKVLILNGGVELGL